MPSRFEPCGLNQLYALRYGTLPVAHKTGGLRDTVTRDVGWPFAVRREPLWRATERAMRCYRDDEERWRKKQTRAMRKNLSWDVAAEQYERLMRGAAAPPTALNREALSLPTRRSRRRRRRRDETTTTRCGSRRNDARNGFEREPRARRIGTPARWRGAAISRGGRRCSLGNFEDSSDDDVFLL